MNYKFIPLTDSAERPDIIDAVNALGEAIGVINQEQYDALLNQGHFFRYYTEDEDES